MIDLNEAIRFLNNTDPKELINWLIDNEQYATVEIAGKNVIIKPSLKKRGKKNG